MSIMRFVAPNGREALAQVRRELGVDALVLSTRKLTGGRVEVLAVGGDEMESLVKDATSSRIAAVRAPAAPVKPTTPSPASDLGIHPPSSGVSTESFEQFVQRQARSQASLPARAQTPGGATAGRSAAGGNEAPSLPSIETDTHEDPPLSVSAADLAVFRQRTEAPRKSADVAMQPRPAQPAAKAPPPQAPVATPVVSAAAVPANALLGPLADAQLLTELQSMRALLLEQMATISTANAAAELHRRNPMQVRAMTRLMVAGFSPEVARHVAQRAPAAATPGDSDRWLTDVLALNVRCRDADRDWLNRGGVFALVGPTGVGKTTSVAKLAARFAVRHGAHALGLITLDAFRVGAHEQLRAYGRILGTPVHLAQDAATLQDLLASMSGKRLVLIDTCGVSQRDERLLEMLAMLEQGSAGQQPIERLLLLNAASHAETLDDVARAWHARQCVGALLTKLDEAVRIGGALDCALRHKLTVLGATNGQRVPEDWLAVDSRLLAAAALKPGQAAFTLAEAEGAVLAEHARRASGAVVMP